MRPWIVVLAPVFFSVVAIGQTPTLDVSTTGVGATGQVRYNDPSTIGRVSVPDVTYDEVRGRYLWDDDWRPGVLMLRNGGKFPLDKIRLNLHTQDVHYVDEDGIERVADKHQVKDVLLFGLDSTQILATFHMVGGGGKPFEIYQQMSPGQVKLLKKVVSHVTKKPYDASVGKVEYRFVAETSYYLSIKGQLKLLDSLNKGAVTAVLISDQASDEWLSSHKNKLKSEEDVVTFLEYYNAR